MDHVKSGERHIKKDDVNSNDVSDRRALSNINKKVDQSTAKSFADKMFGKSGDDADAENSGTAHRKHGWGHGPFGGDQSETAAGRKSHMHHHPFFHDRWGHDAASQSTSNTVVDKSSIASETQSSSTSGDTSPLSGSKNIASESNRSFDGVPPRSTSFDDFRPTAIIQQNRNDDDPDRNNRNITSTPHATGNVILDSIQSQRVSTAANEAAASAIKTIGMQIAERIIATNEALNAKQEVRITIQNSILKDTEVFLTKDGKTLNVMFATSASESADILNQRGGELRSQLMERLKDVDFVEITVDDQSQQNDDDEDHGKNQRHGNSDQEQQGDDE